MESPRPTNRQNRATFRANATVWFKLQFWATATKKAAFAEIFSMAAIGSAFAGIAVPVLIILANMRESGFGVLLGLAPAIAIGTMVAIFVVFPFALLAASVIFAIMRPRPIFAVGAGFCALTMVLALFADFSGGSFPNPLEPMLVASYIVAATGAWLGHFVTFRLGYRRTE